MEVFMKRLVLCLVLVFGLAQFSNLVAQDVQVESLYLGSITDIPMEVASVPGEVLACGVNICDSSWTPRYIIDYTAGQTWYMMIIVCNTTSSAKSFKL
jgi:hypothetical protein